MRVSMATRLREVITRIYPALLMILVVVIAGYAVALLRLD